jgi:hypothetical protein
MVLSSISNFHTPYIFVRTLLFGERKMKLNRIALLSVALALMVVSVPFAFGCAPGKVTGGGQCIVGDNTTIPSASFGFNVMYFPGATSPKGELDYVDHITGMHVHMHEIDYLEVWEPLPGNKPWPLMKAKFGGPCTVDGKGGFTAYVYVEDHGEPGTYDKFLINIDIGLSHYYTGGSDTVAMLVGNIQIHKPPM